MARKKPDIYTGNTVKKRDRLSFKEFVLDVITDTFTNEFEPTEISLSGSVFFTVTLGPSGSIQGYRFVNDELQVDNVEDYIDVYLYGVRQPQDRYDIEIYSEGSLLPSSGTTGGMDEIRFVFTEDITRVPEDVVKGDWDIKGKIKEIV